MITETSEITLTQPVLSQRRRRSIQDGFMTCDDESRKEVSTPTHLLSMKAITRIGAWNVRTMYETGKTAQVTKEMDNYKLQILGISECRWVGQGQQTLNSGHTILYSGHQDENLGHTEGVAIIVNKKTKKALIEWKPVSSRIITARFKSAVKNVTVIQCYAPTNIADEQNKLDFYDKLQMIVNQAPKRDILIIMGDFNAKIGNDNTNKELVMGKHGVGEQNENGEIFTDFCAFNDLVIGGSLFPHKEVHKVTWISPDGKTGNQIDHISVSRLWRRSLLDVRVKRGADVASDHYLVMAALRLKLKAHKHQNNKVKQKFDLQKLLIADVKKT